MGKKRNLRVKEELFAGEVKFERIPCDVLSSKISPHAKLVYMALIGCVQEAGGGECYPSIRFISGHVGVPDTTVRRGLRELRTHGLIRIWRSGIPAHNNYWLQPRSEFQLVIVRMGRSGASSQDEKAEKENKPSFSKEKEEADVAFGRIRERARIEKSKQKPLPDGYQETWVLEEQWRNSKFTEQDFEKAMSELASMKRNRQAE